MPRARHHLVLAALCLLSSGCFTRAIAQRLGVSGWFSIDATQHFTPVPLAEAASLCADLPRLTGDADAPILVLVHGLGGDAVEWTHGALPTLLRSAPAATFMLRWVPYDDRDTIVDRLAAGVTRLAQCFPEARGRIVVLAHSAGGVLSSHATSRMHAPEGFEGTWVTLLTVASPLAGTMNRDAHPNGRQESVFMLDLGTAITAYPAASPGVRVLHLRTQPPGDPVMEPYRGHVPNDPSIGVPGATVVNLPATLDHLGALQYVAAKVADGTWVDWLDPSEASTTVP